MSTTTAILTGEPSTVHPVLGRRRKVFQAGKFVGLILLILAAVFALGPLLWALTTNRPAIVSTSIVTRKRQLPVSPATVPGSRACISDWKVSLQKPSSSSRRPKSNSSV